MNPLQRFAKNVLLSIDQFGNVLLMGDPDETISARCYRRGELEGNAAWRYFGKFVNALFWFEPQHTEQAYRAEQARCHMPSEYQEPGAACDVSQPAANAATPEKEKQ